MILQAGNLPMKLLNFMDMMVLARRGMMSEFIIIILLSTRLMLLDLMILPNTLQTLAS